MKKLFNLIIFSSIIFLVLQILPLINSFPNTAPVYCREMGYTVKNDLCIFSDTEECKLWEFFNNNCGKEYKKDLPCTVDGEYNLPGHDCCEGLVEIKAQNLLNNSNCKDPEPLGSWRICSDCGNGICENKENSCNCKKDCTKEDSGFNNFEKLKTQCEKLGGYCRLWSIDCNETFKESGLEKSFCFKSNDKCCVPTQAKPKNDSDEIESKYSTCKKTQDCIIGPCEQNCFNETEMEKFTVMDIACTQEKTFVESCRCENNKCIPITKVKNCPTINNPKCPKNSEIEYQENDENKCPTKAKCIINVPPKTRYEIKIMPETASQTAIDKLGDLGFTIELKIVPIKNIKKPVYELTGDKPAKLFGFIPSNAKIKAHIDPETGELIKTKKPWWSFLATGV
ncbi:hypothetical protein GOV12_04760 [Candidatus Pacearchaeota archaeon]|nr:hypothetical protein [Candidatus Pacearchaeota archaeon]